MKNTRIVMQDESDAIVQLRLACYSQAREFRLLRPECLAWNPTDTEGIVLAAFDEAIPISTTRALIVHSAQQAAQAMGCDVALPEHEFPAMILGRGATRPAAARLGLHSVLRYHFIESAMETPIRSLLGMVYAHAPRTNLMRQIGYALHVPEGVWDDEVEPLEPVLLGHLPQREFTHARDQLNMMIGGAMREYPWTGEAIRWSIDACRA